MKKFVPYGLLPFCLALVLLACQKERFTSSNQALLQTSVDTLHFDTVFTTAGSVTQTLKIFNDNKEGIRISTIRLAGGVLSPFKINVNGYKGPEVTDLEVRPKDSAYVFVTVNINPSAGNLPFIVRDSIEISYNGNRTFIQLDALGQNAHFLRNKKITGSETWNSELPYVILGRLTVDTNATLTINKGCKVYMHADAPLIVHGSLKANGEKWDSTRVIFASDRLDEPYRYYPGSYPGLIFTDVSKNNHLAYAIIKNAYQGITVVDPSATGTSKLILENCIIDNAYDAGILAVNSSIKANNVLVSNCGKNIVLAKGGNYQFTHCTVASFSNAYLQRKDPVLTVSNYLNATTSPSDLNALFRNCIFWGDGSGSVKEEVSVVKNGATTFNVNFDHVLWRVSANPANTTVTDAVNQDPQFENINISERIYNFRLKEGSPALNKGIATDILNDLDGRSRPVSLSDLGAYERQ